MSLFNKLGHYFIKLFSFTGMLILSIPKIPDKLRSIDSSEIRERIETDNIKDNLSRIREDTNIDEKVSRITRSKTVSESFRPSKELDHVDDSDSGVVKIGGGFTSEEKEKTILILQILSASFVIISILTIFNFISFLIYIPIGTVVVAYITYLLYKKVKLMYSNDFNAYRDFFLMYVAVGIILVIVNTNSNLLILFPFPFLPSLTLLIFALVVVLAVFLIFRFRYYRDFTYGTVLEAGKNMAYVKVEYDIRSNVKPDIYIVENTAGAVEGELVKLKLEEKLLSMGGNKPVRIMESADIV